MTNPASAAAPSRAIPVLAVALDGAGWHPAARHEPGVPADAAVSLAFHLDAIRTAEAAGVDFVTIEDAFGAPVESASPRLDALLLASALAPGTSSIGLVPVVTTTHTEPFHVATGVQTLDFTSRGRAGWQVRVSPAPGDAALVGRREVSAPAPLFDEARDVVEVARRLWDSWQDDAIIRDTATGRFLDRERIHGARFEGDFFSVEGASITPRSPQGQSLVTALAHATLPFEFAAASADLVFVTPQDDADAIGILSELAEIEARADRVAAGLEPLRRVADLLVVLDDRPGEAGRILERLDGAAGTPLASDARVVAGTPDELVDLVRAWLDLGYDGVRLRPARIPADLAHIAERVAPAILGGVPATGATLRERLGLRRPENRHTAPATIGASA